MDLLRLSSIVMINVSVHTAGFDYQRWLVIGRSLESRHNARDVKDRFVLRILQRSVLVDQC